MQEELEFWEKVFREYQKSLIAHINNKYLCNSPTFKEVWGDYHKRQEIVSRAEEFKNSDVKYKLIRVHDIALLFKEVPYDGERTIRIDFLNFIIQKLKCS